MDCTGHARMWTTISRMFTRLLLMKAGASLIDSVLHLIQGEEQYAQYVSLGTPKPECTPLSSYVQNGSIEACFRKRPLQTSVFAGVLVQILAKPRIVADTTCRNCHGLVDHGRPSLTLATLRSSSFFKFRMAFAVQ